jgi:hypothetical protein
MQWGYSVKILDQQTLFAMDGKAEPQGWVHACLRSISVYYLYFETKRKPDDKNHRVS